MTKTTLVILELKSKEVLNRKETVDRFNDFIMLDVINEFNDDLPRIKSMKVVAITRPEKK